jgi:hypothetical protein
MLNSRRTAHLATALLTAGTVLTSHISSADCPEFEGR